VGCVYIYLEGCVKVYAPEQYRSVVVGGICMFAKGLSMIGVIALFLIPYTLIQNTTGDALNHKTIIDMSIEFQPEWIWLYHSVLPVLFLTCFFITTRMVEFKSFLVSAIAVAVVLNLYYIIVPTTCDRPEFVPMTVAEQLVHWTYQNDKPYNCFPSGHVAFAWLTAFMAIFSERTRKIQGLNLLFILWAIGVGWSTLAVKQHYFTDVFAGFLAALCCSVFSLCYAADKTQGSRLQD